jgi:hypothetical protein
MKNDYDFLFITSLSAFYKVKLYNEIVKSNINGLIFDIDDANGLRYAIIKMLDLDFYNLMRKNVCNMNFDLIKDKQVQAYCNV